MQATEIETGLIFDCSHSFNPSRLYGHITGQSAFEEPSSYYFGYVLSGTVRIETMFHSQALPIEKGMYFGLNGRFRIEGKGKVAVIERMGYRGLSTIGGPIEKDGRLLYIDYSRTSLLLPPARRGDPCLNLLTFPKGVQQTMHIHPTLRLGAVSSGAGQCIMPGVAPSPLREGMVFMIEEGCAHSFHTEEEPMGVIAFHPDTDWGPTDESHPMLNRTYRRV
jgi:hypothetical protein